MLRKNFPSRVEKRRQEAIERLQKVQTPNDQKKVLRRLQIIQNTQKNLGL